MSKLIIVGERLNSSRKPVLRAFQNRDEQFVIAEARKQKEAGADYLDINASMMLDLESKTLKWVITLIQEEMDIPIAIDAADPVVMEAGLKAHKGRALINSITGEKQKLKEFAPLIKKYNAQVVVMCLDDSGLAEIKKPLERVLIAKETLDKLVSEGVSLSDIFVDPMVQPIGLDINNGITCLDSIRLIKNFLPIKTIIGLSNISFGMPERQLLNRVFLTLAMQMGLDAAILDPLDKDIIKTILTAEVLLGKDSSCKDYLGYIRSKNKQKRAE